jgi:hypothetical protein
MEDKTISAQTIATAHAVLTQRAKVLTNELTAINAALQDIEKKEDAEELPAA